MTWNLQNIYSNSLFSSNAKNEIRINLDVAYLIQTDVKFDTRFDGAFVIWVFEHLLSKSHYITKLGVKLHWIKVN